MNYDQEDDYIVLHPDPNCCGFEGDCEGCGYFNHTQNCCDYNLR